MKQTPRLALVEPDGEEPDAKPLDEREEMETAIAALRPLEASSLLRRSEQRAVGGLVDLLDYVAGRP